MARIIALAVTMALLSACATTLPGKLYSLQDGAIMEFQIEKSRGTGGLSAKNQKTGENFQGQYTGIHKGGGTAIAFSSDSHRESIASSTTGATYQNSGTASSTSTIFIPPSDATAHGILIGDKGTVIDLYMEIRPGIIPKGHGQGIDNNGNRYQVQF